MSQSEVFLALRTNAAGLPLAKTATCLPWKRAGGLFTFFCYWTNESVSVSVWIIKMKRSYPSGSEKRKKKKSQMDVRQQQSGKNKKVARCRFAVNTRLCAVLSCLSCAVQAALTLCVMELRVHERHGVSSIWTALADQYTLPTFSSYNKHQISNVECLPCTLKSSHVVHIDIVLQRNAFLIRSVGIFSFIYLQPLGVA